MSQSMITAAIAAEDNVTSDATINATVPQAAIKPSEEGTSQPTTRSNRSNKQPGAGSAGTKRSTKATNRADGSKADIILKKLRLARGVTIAQIMEVTGWQSHSVRGFLSAVLRKRLGLKLVGEVGKDGQRRYRVEDDRGTAG